MQPLQDNRTVANLTNEIGELQSKIKQLNSQIESLTAQLQTTEAERSRLQKLVNASSITPNGDSTGNELEHAFKEGIDNLRNRDTLTGLYNRQYFVRALETSLEQEPPINTCQAVIYLLLDDFMEIRENKGIAAGDQVLREISSVIASNCQDSDTVSRFGEYAFTILHGNRSHDTISSQAEKLCQLVAESVVDLEGHPVSTTASIGISIISEHTGDAQGILNRADLACEVARSSGGNQVHTHSTVLDDRTSSDQIHGWDEMIRKTINDGRFYLVYQPIIKLQGDSRKCYEVLLRVVDENNQVVLPGQFLSIAGKLGLSGTIDRWVIDSALKSLVSKAIDDVTLFIKLTGETLADAEFPAWIDQQFKKLDLKGNNIVFEISESVAVNDLKSSLLFTKAIRKLRCRVALEHYGLGKNPQLLKHLPVDILKIDSALVCDLSTNREHQSITQSIINLAKEHKLATVAERVECASNLAQLWTLGVDSVQGNFIHEPGKELDYEFDDENLQVE